MSAHESASESPISGHGPSAAPDDATVISVAPTAGGTTTSEIGRVLEGAMLGPYRLDRFIGGGGMGAVFRALDTTLDRTVAVKVLAGRRADDEEMLRRFRNEAQSAARLDHENIGRVHAVGSADGWHYIVFEYIEGTNLRDLVREQGPLDLARTVDIGIQIAHALEHAARRDVVHRDIKPSNIVITPAGRARLVDMGLARLHHVGDDHDLTSSGMTIGTFDYISPEQARDPRVADVRSDLYSLGCTLFFLLAGRAPFADGTAVQKLLQHQQEAPPAIDAVRPDVPRGFAVILERLMNKDPRDRYQRPAQLAADLHAFAERAGLGLLAAGPLVVVPEVRPASRLPWLVPLLGLAAVVTGLWFGGASARRRMVEVSRVPEAGAAARPGIVRVVAEPSAAHEFGSIAEALARVADGGMIELDYDGERPEPPVAFTGRRLTIQSAAGRSPSVRFVTTGSTAAGVDAACDVGDGELVVRRVQVRGLVSRAGRRGACLFSVAGGRLICEDSILLVSNADEAQPAADAAPVGEVAIVSATPGPPGGGDTTVRLDATRCAGDACLLDVAAGVSGTVSLRWRGGEFVSSQRLLRGKGSLSEPGVDIVCDLNDVVVVCGPGIALLEDGPEQPQPARLRLTATDCRFVVRDASGPILEQAGIAALETYRSAAVWQDVRSRYEGGGPFVRRDGNFERFDEEFPASVLRLPQSGDLPDPAAWSVSGG